MQKLEPRRLVLDLDSWAYEGEGWAARVTLGGDSAERADEQTREQAQALALLNLAQTLLVSAGLEVLADHISSVVHSWEDGDPDPEPTRETEHQLLTACWRERHVLPFEIAGKLAEWKSLQTRAGNPGKESE